MLRTIGVPLDRCHLYGWHTLADLARHLREDAGSFIWRAEHKDESNYRDALQTNALLADLYDLLAHFDGNYIAVHNRTHPKPLKRYPRPWAKDKHRIGRDPIPVSEFDKWYYGGE